VTVFLVGAGPGDPGLMTARALELIASADVIVYDRLIPETALDGARDDASLVYAGKEGHGPSMPQEEITALIIEHGRTGADVVRLKGGDPFVFGRGGEEAEALIDAGIPFEVVPAVSSGIAAPAYAGIPVTHRGAASSVAFVTGHEDPSKPDSDLDWKALAEFPGTLVVFMGVKQLPAITANLIAGGRSADEPAALVHRGTLPGQRALTSTLGTVAEDAVTHAITAPTIAVFGPVAALRDKLAWLEKKPLYGVSVAVTRARAQASKLAARLRSLGAGVVVAPVIRTQTLAAEIPDLDEYDLICFTSPTGVESFFSLLTASGRDARALAGATVAVIGPGTARALRTRGIEADVMPETAVAEALVDELDRTLGGGERPVVRRALIARAAEARDVLPDALTERGAHVDVLSVYETVIEPLSGEEVEAAAGSDFITFTSASTVRNFLQSAGGAEAWLARETRPRVASIGPVTSDELRHNGIEPDLEAADSDIDGLVAALVAAAS
jgi:uroporphyrinogen III methyltransferase / synthase